MESFNHTFIDCVFVKKVSQEVVNLFNVTNTTQFNPSMEWKLFRVASEPFGKNVTEI